MLVEDHLNTARAMARLLTCEGHDVRIASTLRQALKATANHPLDLIICDIGLPDGSGHDLMRRMTPPHPIPAIALSAYVSDDAYEDSRRCGFLAHIAKPVDFDSLLRLIASLT